MRFWAHGQVDEVRDVSNWLLEQHFCDLGPANDQAPFVWGDHYYRLKPESIKVFRDMGPKPKRKRGPAGVVKSREPRRAPKKAKVDSDP